MQQSPGGPVGLSYVAARRMILAVGLSVLVVISAVTYVRRVDPDEVVATILFIPVFLAFVFWNIRGGVLTALAAAIVYFLLRYPDIQVVGPDRFAGLIASRAGAFVAFGLLGGWASRQLDVSLTKLEIYDQIDDATGLFNARFFVQDTDLELTRSQRYRTIFSVAVIDIPANVLDVFSRRQRTGALRELGRSLKSSVRTVDRAVHGRTPTAHRFAVVLPETGKEGVRIFVDRFADRVADYLSKRGITVAPKDLGKVAATYPEESAVIDKLQNDFRSIDRSEHPDAKEEGSAS